MSASSKDDGDIVYRLNPPATNRELNALFRVAWVEHRDRNFSPTLIHSLSFVCAYRDENLVGFVNLAFRSGYDGTPFLRGRGIGRHLVCQATTVAGDHGIEWVHVDFEPRLRGFYHKCGFEHTEASLMRLRTGEDL